MGASLCNDCIWPKILLGELLQGMHRAEVLSLDKYLVTDFEVGCQSLTGICGSLVSLLGVGHLLMEEFMEGVEVYGVLTSLSGGEIMFQMDGEVGVVTFVSKEQ